LLSIANCSIDNILEIMAPRVDSNSWQDIRWSPWVHWNSRCTMGGLLSSLTRQVPRS
jgi:hypothetical protein